MFRPFCIVCGVLVLRLGRAVAHAVPGEWDAHMPKPAVFVLVGLQRFAMGGERCFALAVQACNW